MLLALSLIGTAQALTWTEYSPYLLSPVAGEFYELGLGSPTVVVDQGDLQMSGDETYVLFFESQTGAADVDCTVGYWSIGMATSPDGLTWTIQDGDPSTVGVDDPIVSPGGLGDYNQCVAAHPNAVLVDGTIYVYFKAEQSKTEGAGCGHAWGCSSWVGFGLFAVDDYLTTPVVTMTTEPVLNITTSNGKPSVSIVEDVVNVFYERTPHTYQATGSTADMVALTNGALTALTTPTVSTTNISWGPNAVFNPSYMCTDEPATPFQGFVGGRKTTGTVGGWGSVLLNATFGGHADFAATTTWTGNNDWRAWEVTMLGYAEAPDFLVYFAEKDGTGKNNIGLYSTLGASPTWAPEDVSDKNCDNTCGL